MSDWKNVQYKDGKYRTGEGGGGGSSTFAGLDDVSFNNLQNGQVPKYNSATQKWENANESGGGGTVTDVQVDGVSVVNQQGVAEITMPTPPSLPDKLSDLSDVQFSNLSDHQPLRYNTTNQKWVNGADNYPPLIYSDDEREVGVWRDGKPLYQKSYNLSSIITDGNWNSVAHNISNLEKVVNISGVAVWEFSTNSFVYLTVPFRNENNTNYNIGVRIVSDNIQYIASSNYSSNINNILITLQYTKTTDVAGSGIWTTDGTPTHHYSTSEKVIGTWIDGKPIYEIVLQADTKTNAYANIDVSSLNIDIPLNADVFGRCTLNGTDFSLGSYFQDNNDGINCYLQSNKNTLVVRSKNSYPRGENMYVVLRYTKTTD